MALQTIMRTTDCDTRAPLWTKGLCLIVAAMLMSAIFVAQPARAAAPTIDAPIIETPSAEALARAQVAAVEVRTAGFGTWWDSIWGWLNPSTRTPQATVEHIIIGLDISKSNPLVLDDAFARKVADYVRNEIDDLPLRSKITLRTFGVDRADFNSLRRDRVISNTANAEDAANFFHTIISSVPNLVDSGRIQAQNFTNIVSFMENMAQIVDCDQYATTVILATDGIEDSEYVRLRRSGTSLPAPREGLYDGCDRFLMLGVGQGTGSPTLTNRIRREWQSWSNRAGFRRFQGLNNW